MKVLMLRADAGGCAFYRMQEPARVVRDQFDIDIRVATSAAVEAEQDATTGLIQVHEVKEDVDLIIFQRPLNNAFTSMIAQAQHQGIATIVELDDDFTSVHRKNAAWKFMQPEASPTSNYTWVQSAAAAADMVTVSTPALAEKFAPHGRVEVIRNCVPESIFDIRKQSVTDVSKIVGWSGTVHTHPNDLEQTGGAVAKSLAKNKASFFNIGDGVGVGSALGLEYLSDVRFSGWVPLTEYYQKIADSIGIGIVPLDLSPFNEAKSYLKGLEYAALGIPFVASPTGEYNLFASEGAGAIATSTEEWSRELNKLLKDPRKRYSTGSRYREHIRKNHTYESNASHWYDTWIEAVQIAKARHARN